MWQAVTTEHRAPLRYVVATSAVAALSTLWYVVWVITGAGPAAVAYFGLPIGAAVCAAAVFDLLRHAPLSPAARRFWRSLLGAFAALGAGFAILAGAALRDLQTLPTIPLPAAALAGTAFVMAMWGMGRVPLGITNAGERWRQWLDRSIAFLGCGTLLFHFGLAPMLLSAQLWSTQAIVLLIMSFALAVGGITKVSYIRGGPIDRTALRLIGLTSMVGAVVALLLVLGGLAGTVPAHAVALPLAPVLGTLAVRRQWGYTGARPRRSNTWLPYLAIAAVDVPLIAVIPGALTWTDKLALALGLDTVAEGIENAAQADCLIGLGYTLGQGYHLARPMPADDLTHLLAAQHTLAPAA
jgi:hypothetical protein